MIHESGKLLLMAGPSLLESEKVSFAVAEVLKRLAQKHAATLKVVFRSSFDKPQRSTLFGSRGEGMEAGLRLLSELKDKFGLLVGTDVHERYQVEPSSAICDVLQIPSQLCLQADLVVEAAKSGCVVNIRKGAQISALEALPVVEKVECAHASEVWLTERGSCFGYGDVVVDMRGFTILKRAECPILFDATSPSRLPGLPLSKENGPARFTLPLAKAALASGADGLSIDVHPEPENALVDGAIQLPLGYLEIIVDECLKTWKTLRG